MSEIDILQQSIGPTLLLGGDAVCHVGGLAASLRPEGGCNPSVSYLCHLGRTAIRCKAQRTAWGGNVAIPTGLRSLLSRVWARSNEFALGIRTEPLVPRNNDAVEPWKGDFSPNAKNDDNFRYETMGYWNLRALLRVIRPRPNDVVYDIGCGMGRMLCLAAQRRVKKCIGVELMEPLCQIARQNAVTLRGKKAAIEIVCGDAATADLSEGTIYFLFNPFGPETLRDTFENIRRSITQNPRSIRIVYYHSKYRAAIEHLEWLIELQEFDSFGSHPVTIWTNRHPFVQSAILSRSLDPEVVPQ